MRVVIQRVSEASGYIHGFLSLAQSCAVELREIESADGLHETRADYINALITAAGLFDTMSSGLKELNNSIDELTKGIMAELEIFDGLGIGDIVDDLRIISQILDYISDYRFTNTFLDVCNRNRNNRYCWRFDIWNSIYL